jgi:hypothetical protein
MIGTGGDAMNSPSRPQRDIMTDIHRMALLIKSKTKLTKPDPKPFCFVSYSSRESHVQALLPCIWIAFSPYFDVKLTPSALESGADQLSQINELINECAFSIVVLDGLRPNVTYEFGRLSAKDKPLILIKEKTATVDIKSLVASGAPTAGEIAVANPLLNVDTHFSNVKSIAHVQWDKSDAAATVKVILHEYRKKKDKIKEYVDIKDPQLWLT